MPFKFIHEVGEPDNTDAHIQKDSHNSTLCGKLPLDGEDWRDGSDFRPTCAVCHQMLAHYQ